MKRWILAAILCATVASVVMADGDGLFWSARLTGGQVEFYRSEVPTPGAAECVAARTPTKYVVLDKGEVKPMSMADRVSNDLAEAAKASEKAAADKVLADAQAASPAAAQAAYAQAKLDMSNSIASIVVYEGSQLAEQIRRCKDEDAKLALEEIRKDLEKLMLIIEKLNPYERQ